MRFRRDSKAPPPCVIWKRLKKSSRQRLIGIKAIDSLEPSSLEPMHLLKSPNAARIRCWLTSRRLLLKSMPLDFNNSLPLKAAVYNNFNTTHYYLRLRWWELARYQTKIFVSHKPAPTIERVSNLILSKVPLIRPVEEVCWDWAQISRVHQTMSSNKKLREFGPACDSQSEQAQIWATSN